METVLGNPAGCPTLGHVKWVKVTGHGLHCGPLGVYSSVPSVLVGCALSASFVQSAPCSAVLEQCMISDFHSCVMVTSGACGIPGRIAAG